MALPYQILHTTVNPTLVVLLLDKDLNATIEIMAGSLMRRDFFILPAQAKHGDGPSSQIEWVSAF